MISRAQMTTHDNNLVPAEPRFRLSSKTLNVIAVITVFGCWELVGRFIVTKPLFFVPISVVAEDMWNWISSGEILPHLEASATEFVIGFGIAMILGIGIGMAMGLSRVITDLLEPIVMAFNSTPMLALTPLFIIWFGIGITSKVMMMLFIALVPIIINTAAGMHNVQQEHLDAVRSFGANWAQLTLKVRLPSALSFIIAGLRLGMARALVAIFVVELFGAQSGIGFTIANAATIFDTARVFSGIIVLAGAGVLISLTLTWLERTVAPWRYQTDRGGL